MHAGCLVNKTSLLARFLNLSQKFQSSYINDQEQHIVLIVHHKQWAHSQLWKNDVSTNLEQHLMVFCIDE